MTRGILVALAIVVASPALQHAQEPASETQNRTPEGQQRLRNQIHLMEGVLARAGSIAAETFGSRLQQIDPTMSVTIGQSRAKGFVLDGYGVFFDVEVPELRTTVLLAEAMLQRDTQIGNALALLKQSLKDMPDGPNRRQAEHAIRVLDLQAGPVPPLQLAASSVAATSTDSAIKVSEGTRSEPERAPASTLDVALREDLQAIIRDPRKEYRDAVQRELIDVMLDFSSPIDVAPDQWLTVAARVTEAGQRGQILMLRVKGSDLAIFASDKSRRDEIKSKVEVSVF